MKTKNNGTTAAQVEDIKRFPTVTYPIMADDLHTPQAYAYNLRRAIVTDCTTEQRAELVKLLDGKDTAEGVTFRNSQANRDRLHIWQNREARKQRAAILGDGWQYVEGINQGTQPGDLITCIDGTRGRVTKASAKSSVIEFETESGQRLNVGGYFRQDRNYSTSEKLRNSESKERDAFNLPSRDERRPSAKSEPEGFRVGDKVRHNQSNEVATITAIRRAYVPMFGSIRLLYTLDFGKSVIGPFCSELNGGEFLAEAITPVVTSWATDYTADDFRKLEANPEAVEADPDIMGRRFLSSAGLTELQVFIQDYAGNEAHALYYIWDELAQEVRANVRPLSWLRSQFSAANGWQPA